MSVLEFPKNQNEFTGLIKRLNELEVGDILQFESPQQRLNMRVESSSNSYLVFTLEIPGLRIDKQHQDYYWISCADPHRTYHLPVFRNGIHVKSRGNWFRSEIETSTQEEYDSLALRLTNFGRGAVLHFYDRST